MREEEMVAGSFLRKMYADCTAARINLHTHKNQK